MKTIRAWMVTSGGKACSFIDSHIGELYLLHPTKKEARSNCGPFDEAVRVEIRPVRKEGK